MHDCWLLVWLERECFCWCFCCCWGWREHLSVLFTACTVRHKKLRWWWLRELLKFAICYFAAFSFMLPLPPSTRWSKARVKNQRSYKEKCKIKLSGRTTAAAVDECSMKLLSGKSFECVWSGCDCLREGKLVELEKITASHQNLKRQRVLHVTVDGVISLEHEMLESDEFKSDGENLTQFHQHVWRKLSSSRESQRFHQLRAKIDVKVVRDSNFSSVRQFPPIIPSTTKMENVRSTRETCFGNKFYYRMI